MGSRVKANIICDCQAGKEAFEAVAFANFDFHVFKKKIKVLNGEVITEEDRYALNWHEYLGHLKDEGILIDPDSREFFQRYQMPRPEMDFFNQFQNFQNEIRSIFKSINGKQSIDLDTWQTIFRESEKVGESIIIKPAVEKTVYPEDLENLHFERRITAETYRAFIFGQLRQLILDKKLFQIRLCQGCLKYFLESPKSKNRSRRATVKPPPFQDTKEAMIIKKKKKKVTDNQHSLFFQDEDL